MNSIFSSEDLKNKTKMLPTIGYFLAFIGLGLAGAALGPALPYLAQNTHSRINEISIIFSTRSLGYLVGSSQSGRLYDRIRGHPILGYAMLLIILMMALIPVVPLLWLVAVLTFVLGTAEGSLDVGVNTLIIWVHQHKVDAYMNSLHFFYGVGASLSPIILAQVILATHQISFSLWILALPMLPIALWIFRLPSPAIQVPLQSQSEQRGHRFILILLVAFLLAYVGAEYSYGSWIFTYTIALKLGNETSAAYLTSLFWIAYTLGRFISIPIATRVKPQNVLIIDLIGCLISLFIIMTFPGSLTILWIGTFGTGFFMASVFPTTLTLTQKIIPITGKINSWLFAGSCLGSTILPYVIGQSFVSIGPRTTMITLFIDMVIALGILIILIYSYTRNKGNSSPLGE